MERVPPDLRKVLAPVEAQWKGLTPIARRDFITWVESAKLAETRARRVARVPDMLKSGKRRPCCYAVVPLSIYSALGKVPKAKAQWKELTPDERRDFVSWIESAKDAEARAIRTDRALLLLKAGKRKPGA